MGGSSSKLFKVFFRLLFLVGVVGFLIVEGAENGVRRMKAAANHVKLIDHVEGSTRVSATQKIRALPKLDLNYVNKRKIPNGSDPIHNRKAGSSNRPPGKA